MTEDDEDALYPLDTSGLLDGDASTELSCNRTAMSFERTRASLDRTLMSVLRTSLSLIGFGFTLSLAFHSLINKVPGVLPTNAPRNFGLMLIGLGVTLLVLGLFNHMTSVQALRARRGRLQQLGLIRHLEAITPSTITFIAVLLLLLGLVAFASIIFQKNFLG